MKFSTGFLILLVSLVTANCNGASISPNSGCQDHLATLRLPSGKDLATLTKTHKGQTYYVKEFVSDSAEGNYKLIQFATYPRAGETKELVLPSGKCLTFPNQDFTMDVADCNGVTFTPGFGSKKQLRVHAKFSICKGEDGYYTECEPEKGGPMCLVEEWGTPLLRPCETDDNTMALTLSFCSKNIDKVNNLPLASLANPANQVLTSIQNTHHGEIYYTKEFVSDSTEGKVIQFVSYPRAGETKELVLPSGKCLTFPNQDFTMDVADCNGVTFTPGFGSQKQLRVNAKFRICIGEDGYYTECKPEEAGPMCLVEEWGSALLRPCETDKNTMALFLKTTS